jgi:hypothetical protein
LLAYLISCVLLYCTIQIYKTKSFIHIYMYLLFLFTFFWLSNLFFLSNLLYIYIYLDKIQNICMKLSLKNKWLLVGEYENLIITRSFCYAREFFIAALILFFATIFRTYTYMSLHDYIPLAFISFFCFSSFLIIIVDFICEIVRDHSLNLQSLLFLLTAVALPFMFYYMSLLPII